MVFTVFVVIKSVNNDGNNGKSIALFPCPCPCLPFPMQYISLSNIIKRSCELDFNYTKAVRKKEEGNRKSVCLPRGENSLGKAPRMDEMDGFHVFYFIFQTVSLLCPCCVTYCLLFIMYYIILPRITADTWVPLLISLGFWGRGEFLFCYPLITSIRFLNNYLINFWFCSSFQLVHFP